MYHLPEPARRLSAQILIERPSILEWKNEQTEISWTSGWGLGHWLIGIVFGQSEDGSRLCDHKHLPVGGTGGPEQSENGSGLKIFLNQSEDGWEVENRTCELDLAFNNAQWESLGVDPTKSLN